MTRLTHLVLVQATAHAQQITDCYCSQVAVNIPGIHIDGPDSTPVSPYSTRAIHELSSDYSSPEAGLVITPEDVHAHPDATKLKRWLGLTDA
jgi:hypothetical protein